MEDGRAAVSTRYVTTAPGASVETASTATIAPPPLGPRAAPTSGAGDARPIRRTRWWIELLAIAWLYWLYDTINNLSPIRQQLAVRHGTQLVHVEQRLHIGLDWTLDHWTAHHSAIGTVLGDFYDIAHVWVASAALVWLWWRRPALYPRLRNTLVGVNVVGFVVFWLYPVAPPRMLPGFVDIVSRQHAWFSWHTGTLATAANQLAAMPSLHVAWALWVAVAVWQGTTSRTWRTVGVAHAVLTVVAVMATGNHYTLDVVAGAAALGLSAAAMDGIGRARARRTSRLRPSTATEHGDDSAEPPATIVVGRRSLGA